MDSVNELMVEAIKIGKVMADPKDVGGIKFAVIPADHKVESLEKLQFTDYAPRPHRMKGSVVVHNVESFLDYWKLYSDEDSAVFGNRDNNALLACMDYHEAEGGDPRWKQHWCTLDLKLSEEWKIWNEKNGAKLSQADMATFIEDNAPDVVRPDAATMMEVARTLEAKQSADFDSAIRLDNGQTQFTYKEEIKGSFGTGKLPIPEAFAISIPVYEGQPRIEILARLRYRIVQGKLTLWYDLLRPKMHHRDAFLAVLAQVKETCGRVFIGKP